MDNTNMENVNEENTTEENANAYKGLYFTITLLEDRLKIEKNKGFAERLIDNLYDEIMIEDIDLNHIEIALAKSMIVQGCFTIPLNKKLTLPNIFKGKFKEIRIMFNRDGNEHFQKLRDILMDMR